MRERDAHAGFEGVPRRFGVVSLFVRTGSIERVLRVWFGRAHPTPRQLAAANQELRTAQ